MPNEIPHALLVVIDERDKGRCVRCGGLGGGRHHRRRRRVIDSHTHEPCNVVTLCVTCHDWVHSHPNVAKQMGWIVKPWANPLDHPVYHYQYGWVRLECDGTFLLAGECENCERIAPLETGLCLACLREEVCHMTAQAAADEMCGCGGSAGQALTRLLDRERIEA